MASLVSQLKANGILEAEQTRAMVRQKLHIADADLECETNELKVSLMCPLMKFRMQIPSRSRNCKVWPHAHMHHQFF